MKIKYKWLFAIFFLVFFEENFFSQASQGKELFEKGKAAEAIPLLEANINAGTAAPVEYNYLGLAYYKMGNYVKSAEAFKKGLSAPGTNKKLLYFNLGNTYFAMSDFQNALESYSMAAVADPNYAEPVLNKANAEIKLDKLESAAADYKRYLELRPQSEQRPQIEKILSLIEEELSARERAAILAAEEAARLKAEEERLAAERAEAERLAAEKRAEQERLEAERRAAEEERRRKLLEDVANSLRQNSETTDLSADAENFLDYDYDSDIE